MGILSMKTSLNILPGKVNQDERKKQFVQLKGGKLQCKLTWTYIVKGWSKVGTMSKEECLDNMIRGTETTSVMLFTHMDGETVSGVMATFSGEICTIQMICHNVQFPTPIFNEILVKLIRYCNSMKTIESIQVNIDVTDPSQRRLEDVFRRRFFTKSKVNGVFVTYVCIPRVTMVGYIEAGDAGFKTSRVWSEFKLRNPSVNTALFELKMILNPSNAVFLYSYNATTYTHFLACSYDAEQKLTIHFLYGAEDDDLKQLLEIAKAKNYSSGILGAK